MDEPPLGSIGLTGIRGDAGRLIRLGQWLNRITWKFWTWGKAWKRARYEHAFTYVGDGTIVEAEPGGARLASLTEYDAGTVLWLDCPAEFGQAVADAARSLIGTPYSFVDYLAITAHRLRIPAPGLRRYIESSRHAICSQLSDLAAGRGGWRIFNDGRWCGFVAPNDLAELALTVAQPV
jgi:hypothetical protein